MCYIFSCFGWLLDFIQRAITFVLACILCCVVGLGIVVAIAAGIAYGYNYSMAEFLTFTRQDVTVYMRRGQFYDKPDFDADRELIYRRSGGDDGFDVNKTVDYQDTNSVSNAKGLPDTWSQVKDTKKYAEMLTKFSRRPVDDELRLINQPMNQPIQTDPTTANPLLAEYSAPVRRVSLLQQPQLLQTTVMQSGFSQIVMRNFQPPERTIPPVMPPKVVDNEIPDEDHSVDRSFYAEEEPEPLTKFFKLPPTRTTIHLPVLEADKTENSTPYIPMRHWPKAKPEADMDYTRDDFEEDSVVYKPV